MAGIDIRRVTIRDRPRLWTAPACPLRGLSAARAPAPETGVKTWRRAKARRGLSVRGLTCAGLCSRQSFRTVGRSIRSVLEGWAGRVGEQLHTNPARRRAIVSWNRFHRKECVARVRRAFGCRLAGCKCALDCCFWCDRGFRRQHRRERTARRHLRAQVATHGHQTHSVPG
jgi:hypothetical protein